MMVKTYWLAQEHHCSLVNTVESTCADVNSKLRLQEGGTASGTDTFIDCLCLGTGRFLRSVLVPVLVQAGYQPALIQPRGRDFLEYILSRETTNASNSTGKESVLVSSSYEVDTVLENGALQTDVIPCYGAFSMGLPADREAVYHKLLPRVQSNRSDGVLILGVGVTEAGLASHTTQAMKDLYMLLFSLAEQQLTTADGKLIENKSICVLNTDNIPNNGDVLLGHMKIIADTSNDTLMQSHLKERRIVFLNTMVDRITSERVGSNGLVPRAEPTPQKALVILDTNNNLPPSFVQFIHRQQQLLKQASSTLSTSSCSGSSSSSTSGCLGVVIRNDNITMNIDIALKLRVANGTHTSLAHLMALLKVPMTDILSKANQGDSDDMTSHLLLDYVDALAQYQIIPAANYSFLKTMDIENEARNVWEDWRKRLVHPFFGLSSFFITQNGPSKAGIRLGPTVCDLISHQIERQIQKQNFPSESIQSNDSKCTSIDCNSKLTTNCTVVSEDLDTEDIGISVVMAFAFAILLRWLTPVDIPKRMTSFENCIYTGWLQDSSREMIRDVINNLNNNNKESGSHDDVNVVEYADKLRYNLLDGWYEFRCALKLNQNSNPNCSLSSSNSDRTEIPLSDWLYELTITIPQPTFVTNNHDDSTTQHRSFMYVQAVEAYLLAPDGGNLRTNSSETYNLFPAYVRKFAQAIAILYSHMIDGNENPLQILNCMKERIGIYAEKGMNSDCSVLLSELKNNPSHDTR